MKNASVNSGNSGRAKFADVFGVILAGGSGTRLWPLSRKLLPKQFLRFGKEESLFEKTVSRITPLTGKGNVVIVTNRLHAFGSGCRQLKKLRLLIEPEARNTAPAIGLACLYLLKTCKNDPIAVVLPSDHMIIDSPAFIEILSAAVKEARKGKIVTIGVKPETPDTGYGYIKAAGGKDGAVRGAKCLQVERFIEKPSAETARKYLKSGGYYWNAGIFVFKASVMLGELDKYLPAAGALLAKIGREAFKNGKLDYRALSPLFSKMPSLSIDYAVMEKSGLVFVIPSEFGWSDVGNWRYLYGALPKDGAGNVKLGDVVAIDSRNNLLYSGSRLVTAIGVENLAVIETRDAILVSEINRSQEVKKVIAELKKRKRREVNEHVTVERHWGSYTMLEDLPNYNVKKLNIRPGCKISYQYHKRRTEHWFVVRGSAEVTLNGKKMTVSRNRHVDNLEVIEVQSGKYLGEDDIIRLNGKADL